MERCSTWATYPILIILLAACAHPPAAPNPSTYPPSLLLRDVTLIDGTGAPPREHVSLLIRSGVIAEIAEAGALAPPARARVVEGRGRYVIPGLWDAHVHLTYGDEATLGVLVASGVTAVRDMGGDLALLDFWRGRIERGELVGPHIFRAGPTVDGFKPGVPYRLTVAGAEDARGAVRHLQRLGVDFLKVHTAVPREAYFALAEEARARGIPLAGHVPGAIEPAEAVAAGQRSVEHIATLLEGRYLARFPTEAAMLEDVPRWLEEDLPALAAAFAARGMWFTPTLVAYEVRARRGQLAEQPDPRLRYVSPAFKAYWDQFSPVSARDRDPEVVARRRRFVELGQKMTLKMHQAGAGIAVGTDLAARDVIPGFAVHDEIALLVAAGLSPMAALRAATAEPARLLGVEGVGGTLTAGRAADLVLLEGNPVENPENLGRIAGVSLRGRWLAREDLDRLLAQTAERE